MAIIQDACINADTGAARKIPTPGKQVLTVVLAGCVSRYMEHKNYISDSSAIYA